MFDNHSSVTVGYKAIFRGARTSFLVKVLRIVTNSNLVEVRAMHDGAKFCAVASQLNSLT